MADDIFCKIINKEWKAEIVSEESEWIAIKDIHPQAPVHVLIIPKRHLESLEAAEDRDLLGALMLAVKKVAAAVGLAEGGYRIVINNGKDGGQGVPHLHLHLLGGRALGPKMVK